MVLRALPDASAFQSYAGHITATVDSQRNISSSVAHTTAFDVSHHRAETADDFLQTPGDLA